VDLTGNAAPAPLRLTLAEPFKRTLTVLDSEDRPLAGVRLAPLRIISFFYTPDDWLERLTVVTAADGTAALMCLPVTSDPLAVRASAPGIAPHSLPLPERPGSDRFTLKLGRPARLAGSLAYDSGEPAGDIPVEVWVQNLRYSPAGTGGLMSVGSTPIHFDSGPLRTRKDGSFETPQQLMTGSSYRITIHPEGRSAINSDWITATTELTNAPPLRLRMHRKVFGLVQDRQGQAVSGARIFLPSGSPTTATDEKGRFLIEGVLPQRTYLLVTAPGFRFQGWPAVPAREPKEQKLVLVRTSEQPDRVLAPLPSPISSEESRALARRVLEPYLQVALKNGDDRSKWECLRRLAQVDPERALALLPTAHFLDSNRDYNIRCRIAAELVLSDPVEAESIVAALETPVDQVYGYLLMAAALPAAEIQRKRALLERATVQVRAPAGGGKEFKPATRVNQLARVARGWLDLGDVEHARPLIDESLKLAARLPQEAYYQPYSFPTAARLELDQVLSLLRDMSKGRRKECYLWIAAALANERPADAERVFQLIEDTRPNQPMSRSHLALWLCGPMAKADPKRAERLIGAMKTSGAQACGWAVLALAVADREKAAARLALDRSIQLIDGLIAQPIAAEGLPFLVDIFTNPAASILPIVEKVAPEQLEEVFWKAVALMPRSDTARRRGIPDNRVAAAAVFLARYDRGAADLFLTQAKSTLPRGTTDSRRFVGPILRIEASADPRVAVAEFESLSGAGDKPYVEADGSMPLVLGDLIETLIEPYDEHWKRAWRSPSEAFDRPFP
jgi:Carboxypeptidase regulatory-like domain